jgi:hypothetical protein
MEDPSLQSSDKSRLISLRELLANLSTNSLTQSQWVWFVHERLELMLDHATEILALHSSAEQPETDSFAELFHGVLEETAAIQTTQVFSQTLLITQPGSSSRLLEPKLAKLLNSSPLYYLKITSKFNYKTLPLICIIFVKIIYF